MRRDLTADVGTAEPSRRRPLKLPRRLIDRSTAAPSRGVQSKLVPKKIKLNPIEHAREWNVFEMNETNIKVDEINFLKNE